MEKSKAVCLLFNYKRKRKRNGFIRWKIVIGETIGMVIYEKELLKGERNMHIGIN